MIEEFCAFSQGEALKFLADMGFYLKTFEEFVEKEKSQELKLLEERADRIPKSRRGEFWADYYPIHWENIFEAQLRSSFVVSLSSFVEDYLKTVCWEVSIIQRVDEDPRTWTRGLLRRFREFLRSHGFSDPGASEWSFLYNVYRLRNVFVHNGGHLNGPREYPHLDEFISSEAGLGESNGYIELNKEFCFRALEVIDRVVKSIQQQETGLCRSAGE
jgi:hypothetical protein